jgi:alpha-N-acetylglucosamine transferase
VNLPAAFAAPVLHKVQSRKENHSSPHSEFRQESNEGVTRKVSQTFAASNSSHKRQRVVTPAASKVIDAEDEPRTSPSSRKISRTSEKQDSDSERRVLSGIENV